MSLKSEIISGMYSRIRISGITVEATPKQVSLALKRLEGMMAQFEKRSICLGYNFTKTPDPDDETGVEIAFEECMETNLAIRHIPDFNKIVPQSLMDIASATLSGASSYSASQLIRQVQPSQNFPRGSGNTLRYNRWQRFNRPIIRPDPNCETFEMDIGEIGDFSESFKAYLKDETITSFTIVASQGLTAVSSSKTDGVVDYRIKAVDISTTGSVQKVTITITTSTGRIEIREIDFEITRL